MGDLLAMWLVAFHFFPKKNSFSTSWRDRESQFVIKPVRSETMVGLKPLTNSPL